MITSCTGEQIKKKGMGERRNRAISGNSDKKKSGILFQKLDILLKSLESDWYSVTHVSLVYKLTRETAQLRITPFVEFRWMWRHDGDII